ncbi:MAG TPA: response regulator transcription factor [Verrucomicrobiae bacterium]
MIKKVAIVEDDRGLREQLAQILGAARDVRLVGACASAEEAIERIHLLQPDVVLMDIKLPGMSGIECVTHLKKALPSLQILMLTVYEDSDRIFRALKAGADGYLVKSSPPEALLEAIDDVHRGGSPISSHIARKVVRHFHLVGLSSEESENLSPREQEVLNLLSAGYLYKEISDQLGIGIETVRTHVKNICEKMHVRNRVEAVARHGSKTAS